MKGQVDSRPRDDGTLMEKRKELQREVIATKRTLAQQVKKNYTCCILYLVPAGVAWARVINDGFSCKSVVDLNGNGSL